jgi:hypothetical protein
MPSVGQNDPRMRATGRSRQDRSERCGSEGCRGAAKGGVTGRLFIGSRVVASDAAVGPHNRPYAIDRESSCPRSGFASVLTSPLALA